MEGIVEEHDLLVCPRCLAVFRTGFRACPRDGEALTETRTDPLIGAVFAERYQIEAVIGEGGIGRVYRARHARMSRRYALKIPYGEVAYDPKVRARFANEAEAASRLSHPNVVGVVDFGETPTGLLYMAMDYAEGKSLAALIGESGPLARDWVVRFTRQIAEGLAHAHDKGLVHRDLKPDNIIIERDGDRPRIVDFGLAIFREQEGGRMTTQGTVLGTPHYMAPEQATGQDIDQRTDLFALGLIIYEMLAGVLPFDGTPVQVARKNLSSPVPLIGERVPGLAVDPGLEALCHHLLAKRADDRPASANAVIEMLDRLDRGDTDTWQMEQQPPPAAVLEAPPATANLSAPPAPANPAAPSTTELAELVADTGRRRAVILAALLLVVGGGVMGWKLLAPSDAAPRVAAADAAPADAAAIVAIAAADAAVAVPVAEAAPVAVEPGPADAAPRPGKRDARDRIADRKHDARTARPPIDAPVIATPKVDAPAIAPAKVDAPKAPVAVDAPPVIAQKAVTDLYARVGADLKALANTRGEAVAAPLRAKWTDIPYLDGMGNPTLRPELIRRLRELERAIAKAN
jgi:serine/threonine-protein kinase